jgi:enamine deaminase RidA (YjgF/YER057c/UK114 family)
MSTKRLHVGRRMSQAVIHDGMVYLAGQVAQNTAGKSVGEQTTDIVQIIDDLLKEAGTDKTRLLAAQIWLADIATFDEMNEVWDAWVAPGNPPARACVEAKLARPQFTVEIMVIAALP